MLQQLLRLAPRSIRESVVVRSIQFDERTLDGVVVKVADTAEELQGAARVVHDAFVARGIANVHATGLHFHPQAVVPTSLTFVAKRGDRVIGTIALLVDSPLGLPMGGTYGAELDALRRRGERLAEFSAVAVSNEARRTGVYYLLNRAAIRSAIALGIDRVVIAVHPRSQDLFQGAMLFEPFGRERGYVGLNRSARAVALGLPVDDLYGRFLSRFRHLGPVAGNAAHLYFEMGAPWISVAPENLEPDPARSDAYGLLARARMDLFRSLPGRQISFLKRALPGVLWPSRSNADWSHEVEAAGLLVDGLRA